jgi:DNA-directed RNA polymerase subunit RPC12/RpoP
MGRSVDGYLPNIKNLGGGDDLEISVCLDCGQAQGDWPVEGPEFDLDFCPECGFGLPVDIDPDKELVCPDCTYIILKGPNPEPEVRVHGGDCEVQVPVKKCRLLVPIEFAGYEIGRELFIERESPKFFYVEIMHNWVKLTKGVEAESV